MNAYIMTLKVRVDSNLTREQGESLHKAYDGFVNHPGVTWLDCTVDKTFYIQPTKPTKTGRVPV